MEAIEFLEAFEEVEETLEADKKGKRKKIMKREFFLEKREFSLQKEIFLFFSLDFCIFLFFSKKPSQVKPSSKHILIQVGSLKAQNRASISPLAW